MKFDKDFSAQPDYFMRTADQLNSEARAPEEEKKEAKRETEPAKTKKEPLSIEELKEKRKTRKNIFYRFGMKMDETLYRSLCQIAYDDGKPMNSVIKELIEKEYKKRGY